MCYDTGMENSIYIVWDCPECSWFRVRTDTREWDTQVIDHPVYGPIPNIKLYTLDILNHDCEETRLARLRRRARPTPKPRRKLMIERVQHA